jgi:hypothetical protein
MSSIKIWREERMETKAEIEFHKKQHEQKMSNPIYQAGFNCTNRDDCPYEFDAKLHEKIRILALKSTRLTDKEKDTLMALNEEFEKAPYEQWIHGFYYRKWIDERP